MTHSKDAHLGFCLSPVAPNAPLAGALQSRKVSSRTTKQKFHVPTHPHRAASMSLTNDLLIKGLEVGVATFVGKAAGVQMPTGGQARRSEAQSGRTRKKKRRPSSSAEQRVEAEDVRGMVEEVVRVAGRVGEVAERGGPEAKKWVKLAICIGIDLVGSGSVAVPLVGDALDLVTAPLAAVMLQALFGSTLVTVGGLAEELLPGTDVIPTATLAWLAEYYGYLNGKADEASG
ncbi:unnamed protein product [Chondrus crispus]|uniref:Uncharacterized protein n=1 Tax=Chondrus crispus TaxID=2769 RepID=R7QBM9_CHOCR|nr:unnamed protein product [Chondrus crispus]CDF35459.1 unnamed protein product [Chondrus crispus]|eukprot:XP_005715278.1 unnamed protein product [Chondrus crispus]